MADVLRLPQDKELLAAVGRVSIANSKLDYVLRLTIKSVTGRSLRKSRDETNRNTSDPLRKKLSTEARTHLAKADVLAKIDDILSRAKAATERRNRLIHDITYYDRQGKFVLQENNDPPRLYPTPKEINAIAYDIMKIASELHVARKRGFIAEAILDSRPPKQPARDASGE